MSEGVGESLGVVLVDDAIVLHEVLERVKLGLGGICVLEWVEKRFFSERRESVFRKTRREEDAEMRGKLTPSTTSSKKFFVSIQRGRSVS